MSEELLFPDISSDAPAKRVRKPKAPSETSTGSSHTGSDEAAAKKPATKRVRSAKSSPVAETPPSAAPAAASFTPAPQVPSASSSDTVRSILAAAAETVRSSAPVHHHHAPAHSHAVSSALTPPPIPVPPPLPDYIPGAAPLPPVMVAPRPQGQGQGQGQHGQERPEGFDHRDRRGRRRRGRDRDRDRDRGERPGQPIEPAQPQGNGQQNGNQGRHQQGNGQQSHGQRDDGRHRQQQHQPRPQQGQAHDDDDRDRLDPQQPLGPPEAAEGLLELSPKGFGFLRLRDKLYAQLPADVFVSADLIRKYGLREAMNLKGEACKGHRGLQMTTITEVNGAPPEDVLNLPLFEELKAINPNKRYQLETTKERLTTRVIDMMTPVGRGQRGLIVAPPRAGKTTLLQHVAEAIIANYPQVHLMILLVDERPEEVTEFRRVLTGAEIFASSNDSDTKSHTRISTFAIERAKRLVEQGQHVFMLMDSITRLARAFNNAKQGGATGSGGMGVGAMEIPRRLFAAARNTRTAGSLTILATALIETGSRMDDVIFQEFKGTGNMELVLDRKIAEQYIYPAVNIFKSGTRREELLLPAFQIEKIHMLRRGLGGHKPIEAIQRVISLQERYANNAQLLMELPSK